jgi:hypothetical protein
VRNDEKLGEWKGGMMGRVSVKGMVKNGRVEKNGGTANLNPI